mmetsp:Transcript_27945/g.61621  ORF Transcript_27945/g.61621 Transcript_27945/m.61621 type:complete len:326 (-) Transcript_27945:43-1020(-)
MAKIVDLNSLDGLADEEEEVDQENSDEDDVPPPLEAVRSLVGKAAADHDRPGPPSVQELAAATAGGECEKNEAASALMDKAIAMREQRRQEVEKERKAADLSSGGLKKGFLSSKARKTKNDGKAAAKEEVPFIAGAGTAQEAREVSLRLPEVQHAMKNATQSLQNDQSWVTPQLLQAMGSRPDLMQGMQNPKIQAALQLMQTDPAAAQQKYKDDAEVGKFFKEFSSLMGTHFDVLSGSQAATDSKGEQGAATASKGSESAPANPQQPTMLPPEVAACLKDREVQQLLNAARAGMPLELHAIGQSNPRLFQKVKVLLDAGLLSMQT